MARSRRRESVEETMERLRLISCECSGLGLEEEDAGEVEQASTAKEGTMTVRICPECREETAHFNGVCAKCPPKFCCECNISFGSAEKRFAIAGKGVAHEDCYTKWFARQRQVTVYPRYAVH